MFAVCDIVYFGIGDCPFRFCIIAYTQASQRSGATVVFRARRRRPVPGHDIGELVRPGLMSAALGPVEVPTAD